MFYSFSFQPCSSCAEPPASRSRATTRGTTGSRKDAGQPRGTGRANSTAVPEDVTVQPLKGLSLSLCDECQKRCSVLEKPPRGRQSGYYACPEQQFQASIL